MSVVVVVNFSHFRLLLQNHWASSTKLGTMHPWVKGIQVCSIEGPCPFPRGDNYEIAKIHWKNLKIFFSKTTEPISTKLGTMHPWVKGIQFCSNEGPRTFPRGDNFKWKHVKFIAYSRTSIYSNIDYQEMSMKLLRWTRWNQYRSKDWPYDSYYWKPLLVVLFRTVQAIQLKVWYHNIPSDKIQLSFLELWFKNMKYVNGKSSLLINQLVSFLTANILI